MVYLVVKRSGFNIYINKTVTVNPNSFNPRAREAMRKGIYDTALEWQDNESINDEIRSEFARCVAQSSASSRVKDMVMKLFSDNNFQTLK